jgi:hypothetical protein
MGSILETERGTCGMHIAERGCDIERPAQSITPLRIPQLTHFSSIKREEGMNFI